jgi:osmotically-inducible protein OsmY
LTGSVTDLLEAEAAEEVAARVPGVTEVDEQLDVATL